MKVKLTENDAEEVGYKLTTLAESPDLCEDYGLTVAQAEELRASVLWKSGEWEIPEWAQEAVKGEIEDHCIVLDHIAADARRDREVGQALQISRRSKRLGNLFSELN